MTQSGNEGQETSKTWSLGESGPDKAQYKPDAFPQIEGYKILKYLGEGGMGTVWHAVQLGTHREVALKIVGRGAFGSEKDRARFEREVELTARLQHPNIAQVYDSGVQQGLHYYAMELIAGVDLTEYVRINGPGQRQILQLMSTVCKAVQHAHQRGVVHRDLKPSNILVTSDGQPHILDFGLAKGFLEKDRGLTITAESFTAGTPAYMSPEQAAGQAAQIDTRTDVYSLGAILFQLLTNQLPHELSGTPYQVVRRIAEEEIRRPREITKAVDRELEALLLKALAHDPEERYRSAADVAQDIENYLTGEPLTAKPPTTMYFLRKRIGKYRVPVAIACSVLAALIAMAVFSYARIARERNRALAAEKKETTQRRKAEEALREVEQEKYYNAITLAEARIADSQFEEAEAFLWDTPKERRSWEWGRLMNACHQDLLTLKGHFSDVTSVAFSPDGKRVVTGSIDGALKVWDAETGWQISTVTGHSLALRSVALSPDGKRVVTGSSNGALKVWDAETGREVSTLGRLSEDVWSAAFSPDGKRVVTGSARGIAKVWDVETGREISTLSGHSDRVHRAAFSLDGKRVATASWDDTAKVWNAETGQAIVTLKGHLDYVGSAGFSPDGRRVVTASHDETAKVWDAETGRELLSLDGHHSVVWSGAFSPDGKRVVTGGGDRTAKVWDAETGQEIVTLKGHSGAAMSVAFSPDGKRVLTGSDYGEAKVWDAETGPETLILKVYAGAGYHVPVAFAPDGRRVVTANWDKTAKVWDVETGREVLTLKGHSEDVVAVAFSPDGKRVMTGSDDMTAKVWDAETGHELLPLSGHSQSVLFVGFSSDGKRVATASRDTTARLWDAETGREILSLRGALVDANCAAPSPDLKRVVTGSNDGTARVWDAESGQPILTLRGHSRPVYSVAFSLDGKRVVTGSEDRTAKVWDAERTREAEIVILRGHSDVVLSVAFSPDGKRVVTGSKDKTVKLWDSETGQEILTLRGHSGAVASIAFSPDGKLLATTGLDGEARIWHALDYGASREEHERQKHARYREWLLAKCGIKAMEAEPQARTAAAYAIPVLNLRPPQDMEACAAHFRDVYAAIKKYEKDKGKLPNWLSDLVPKYLSKDRLLCPQDPEHRSPYYPDPSLPCSYTFEFSPAPVPAGWKPTVRSVRDQITYETATCRDWKKTQVKLFGDVVPLTRCLHHGSEALNLSVGGRIYRSDMNWEYVFKPDYRLGDLSSGPR